MSEPLEHEWERHGAPYTMPGGADNGGGPWHDWRCVRCDRLQSARPGKRPRLPATCGQPDPHTCTWAARDVLAVTVQGAMREVWEFGCIVCGKRRKVITGKGGLAELRARALAKRRLAAEAVEPTWPVLELQSA